MKKIHYKIHLLDDDMQMDEDRILTTGTIDVKKALKNHTLAWVEKEEKCMREIFCHGNVNNIYFDFSFEVIVSNYETEQYINECGGNYFEADAIVEEHVPDTVSIKETHEAWVQITIE